MQVSHRAPASIQYAKHLFNPTCLLWRCTRSSIVCPLTLTLNLKANFNLICPTPSSLESIGESFMLLHKFSSYTVCDGRGVMCSEELKNLEIVLTGFFCLPTGQIFGACYHQYPVKKVNHLIPTADFYVCGLNHDGFPSIPIVLGDMKLENIELASKETTGYCVK